ncbi:site-2 protease family protein [Neorhodopirellula pilleata]|uniref:Peptidase family M50 n=1 Tax=Neorhodopirellula pilleata TaxID=2714738 RepID=A0A5C5ZKN7_9BACT|nr:site-2 protease family protein [Neorhodopirellula pilleata]TWT87939.1 Peptidase family M50 [Neorhodopirellula pilleata]
MGATADPTIGLGDRMVEKQVQGPQDQGSQDDRKTGEDKGTGDGVADRLTWSVLNLPAEVPVAAVSVAKDPVVEDIFAEDLVAEGESDLAKEAVEPHEMTVVPESVSFADAADGAKAPVVRIDEDVEFTPVQVAGVSLVRCVHRGTGQHYQFGAAEYHVAMMLDGTRNVSQIVAEAHDSGLDWTSQDVAEFIGVLISQKIATTSTPATPPPAEKVLDPFFSSAMAFIGKTCSFAISLRFPLAHADPIARRVTPWLRPMLSRRGSLIVSVMIAITLFFAWVQRDRLAAELMRIFDSKQWWVALVGWAVLKFIHETGHACVARHLGVRCGRAGVMFFMFAPMAYVDVTEAWKLPRRTARMAIAMGGVYFELICASLALWVWWWCEGSQVGHVAAQIFFLAGPATLLVNANPLLRLDGYYVLSDLVDVPNLREQGRRLFGGAVERRLFGMIAPKTHLNGWRRSFAAYHAAASVVFQFVWMGGLVIVVSMWAGPLGLLIAGSAVFLWTVIPTTRWFIKVWNYTELSEEFSIGSHRRRFLWVTLTVLAVLQFLITLPSPLIVSVPVVVRFANDQILRAPASGFVQQVYFQSGDQVRQGEVIVQLRDDELAVRRDEIRLELESEAIQWQLNERQDALGLAEASQRRSESLRRKLSEIEEQIEAMRIKAIEDGEILTPMLEKLHEAFVVHGQELVQTGNRNRKELLISIGEDQMDTYNVAVQQGHRLRVCFRGGQWLDVVPSEMLPRASREVPHPAMSATAGGPLAVSPTHSDSVQGREQPGIELIAPRFEAVVPLSPGLSDSVRCGELGEMALQDKRSLAHRFWIWLGG